MANTVNVGLTTTSNTFNQWRITDNLMANDVNEIARGNFTKPAGNVTVSDGIVTISKSSGVVLTVASDTRIAGLASIHSIESDADGHVYLPSGDITLANRASGSLFQANINTIFTSANVTISNTTVGGTFNVASNTTLSAQNVMISNATAAALFEVTPNTNFYSNISVSKKTTTTNLVVSSIANIQTGNITTLWVQDLTVQNAIAAPSESGSASYRLRVGQGSRQDGAYGVWLGSSANGNAWINFDTTNGNVWRVTENSTAGIYKTIITSGNVSDSISTTSSNDVASLTAVKAAYDRGTAAYTAANNITSGSTQLTLKGYKDFIVSNTNVNGANTIDLSVSNWYKYTLTSNSTITFANAPAAGNGGTITLVTIQGSGGNKNITWSNTIYWSGGQVPPISNTAAGNTDIWTFFTFDGGSTFIGTLAVKDAR